MSGERLAAGGLEGMLSRREITISYYQGLVMMSTVLLWRAKEKFRQGAQIFSTYNQGG